MGTHRILWSKIRGEYRPSHQPRHSLLCNLFCQIGKDNLRVVILYRIITFIFTLMDATLATVGLRAKLRRTIFLLSDDASSGAMLLQIRIDLFIAILLQPLILFRRDCHITDQEGNSCIFSCGQVFGLNIRCFVNKIPLQPYRRQYISLRDRRTVICCILRGSPAADAFLSGRLAEQNGHPKTCLYRLFIITV